MINVSNPDHVALLIDADNAQLKYIEPVLELCEYYGKLDIRRAFGDWKQWPLKASRGGLAALGIERIQVDRVRNNATDHWLMLEAGKILGEYLSENTGSVFVIVSGDGDFTSACKFIRDQGADVIGIGNRRQTSSDLQKACTEFYCLEDVEQKLGELRKRSGIPPADIRAFFHPLFHAYHALAPEGGWGWVPFSQLGTKLRETVPDYRNRFGRYPLSEWLKHFGKHFEIRDQMVRRVDPNPQATRRSLIIEAYIQTKDEEGLASLTDLDKALRALARDYNEQFGNKKLSTWIKTYPDDFEIRDGRVIHTRYITRTPPPGTSRG